MSRVKFRVRVGLVVHYFLDFQNPYSIRNRYAYGYDAGAAVHWVSDNRKQTYDYVCAVPVTTSFN